MSLVSLVPAGAGHRERPRSRSDGGGCHGRRVAVARGCVHRALVGDQEVRRFSAASQDIRSTRKYASCMKNLQIRNVPDDVHRRLKARAAMEGRSLSELALDELRKSLERPTRRELLERVRARERAVVTEPAADAVRAERDAR